MASRSGGGSFDVFTGGFGRRPDGSKGAKPEKKGGAVTAAALEIHPSRLTQVSKELEREEGYLRDLERELDKYFPKTDADSAEARKRFLDSVKGKTYRDTREKIQQHIMDLTAEKTQLTRSSEAHGERPSGEVVELFANQVHYDVDRKLGQITEELRRVEQALAQSPDSKRLEQLEVLRLTKTYIETTRDAQKELDEDTRFLYEGLFAKFTNEHLRDQQYQRRGAGGLQLMLDAVNHARLEVKRLQEAEPDKTKRSKLIPKPIEEHELKTWQNNVSLTLRTLVGPTSAVLDTGLVVGLFLSNIMARTGEVISYTNPIYGAAMAVGLLTVGKSIEDVKRTALTDDLLTSPEYLSDREKKGRGKQRMSAKQMRAIAATFGYSLMQFEGVLVAVAGAQQGGETYREVVAAQQNVGAQLERLNLPPGFDAADFADPAASAEAYGNLNETGQFFANFHRKCASIIAAEAGGVRIAGAGGSDAVGRGRNWGGKYAILMGTTETDATDLLASAPAGLNEGMAARARIREDFRERIGQIDLEAGEGEELSSRGQGYHDVAESIIRRHFDLQSTVLLEGVSVEQQAGAFYNDFIQALDDDAFVDPTDPTGQARISLRELRVLYETGALETGAEVALWSDEPTDTYVAKLAQSAGIPVPNRSTVRPHVLRVEDVMPLFEYMQNTLFTERTELLMNLLERELSAFDSPGAGANSGISLDVPRFSIDVTPYTEDINTNPSSTWFSWETHHDAFRTWERAGMSMSVLALILLINFGGPLLMRARIKKTEQSRRQEFDERRAQLEGEDDRTEGAEYLLAEHLAEGLNRLVQSPAVRGVFPEAKFTPDMVQAAMREAAASDEVPVMANSPFASPESPVGKVFHGLSRYPHGLAHMANPLGLPEPPAVEAFNHLVTLYNDRVGLTVRIAEQMLPGFGSMMETLLEDPTFVKKALLPTDQFKLSIQNASPEEQKELAARRAKIVASVHDVAIGHHAFATRYAKTKIEHLTEDAFDELYGELAEASEENRGKYLDLTKTPLNLLEDNIDAFDANNPGMLDTMRESGLRQTIASHLEKELAEAAALIETAEKETERLEAEEVADTGLFGGEAGRIIRTAQDRRRARLTAESKTFSESTNPHVRQFSSTTAIREQVFQDVKRSVLGSWYESADRQERTKNWAGIPVREQLKSIQAAAQTEGIYFLDKLPFGRDGSIDAFGKGGPLEGTSVRVQIESRKKRRKGTKEDGSSTDAGSDENIPQIQVDRHVITFEFLDRDRKVIFKIPVEIRSLLSKVMDRDKIKKRIVGWLEKRTEYFTARTLLDSIDELAHEAHLTNEQQIQTVQSNLAKLGFATNTSKKQQTNDFVPVVLSKKNSKQAVRVLMTDLLPRLARRQVLGDIMGKRGGHASNVERMLTPRYVANKYEDGKLQEDTRKRLGFITKLYADLRSELTASSREGTTRVAGTLESRVQGDLIRQVENLVDVVEASRRDLSALGVTVSFIPRSPEFVTITRKQGAIGRLMRQPEKTDRVKIADLLEFVSKRRPSTRQFAEYLRDGAKK